MHSFPPAEAMSCGHDRKAPARASLPAAEISVCVATWAAFVPFTIYKVHQASAGDHYVH